MSQRSVGLFFRPSNLTMTTLLQSLSIMKYLAQKSGNQLVSVQAPRAESQKMLNYGGVRVKDGQKAESLVHQAHRVAMSSRAVLDSATLERDVAGGEGGVGLKEVADLIGIRLGSAYAVSALAEEAMSKEAGRGRGRGRGGKMKDEHMVEVKVERRYSDARVRRDKLTNVDPYKQAHIDVLFREFGGFSQRADAMEEGKRQDA